MSSSWSSVSPYSVRLVSLKEEEKRHRRESAVWQQRQTLERYVYRPRNAKDSWQHQKLRENHEQTPPWNLQRERSSADTLISDFCGLQNGERTNFYCVKPPSLWYFVMAAPGNQQSPQRGSTAQTDSSQSAVFRDRRCSGLSSSHQMETCFGRGLLCSCLVTATQPNLF